MVSLCELWEHLAELSGSIQQQSNSPLWLLARPPPGFLPLATVARIAAKDKKTQELQKRIMLRVGDTITAAARSRYANSREPMTCLYGSVNKTEIGARTPFRFKGKTNLKFHRLYSDADGESHWQDVNVELHEQTFAPPAKAIEISAPDAVKQTMFLKLRAGWDEPVHPTPVMQKLICLAGTVRVTASDGEVRNIGPGDVWHMEDKHGKGHHTVVTSAEDFLSVIIQYE